MRMRRLGTSVLLLVLLNQHVLHVSASSLVQNPPPAKVRIVIEEKWNAGEQPQHPPDLQTIAAIFFEGAGVQVAENNSDIVVCIFARWTAESAMYAGRQFSGAAVRGRIDTVIGSRTIATKKFEGRWSGSVSNWTPFLTGADSPFELALDRSDFYDQLAVSIKERFGRQAMANAWVRTLGYMSEVPVEAKVKALSEPRLKIDVFESLLTALTDSNHYTRQFAARVLGKIGDARASEPLKPLLLDQDVDVRRDAVSALGELGDASTLSVIKALADGEADEHTKRLAVDALAKVRQKIR